MQFFAVLLLLGLCATPWVAAVVYQDLDLEAIVIDDSPDDSLELEAVEELTTQTSTDDVPTCTNANGVPGTCIKFEECYPYISEFKTSNLNYLQLYEILNETATPCESDSGLVCCTDHTYGLPIRKPQFEGQTSENPSNNITDTASTRDSYGGIRNNCGINKYQDNKVVGGRKAQPGEFPFAVALLNKGRAFCGGSLISDQWVLTAAHCIANLKSFSNVAIHAGDHDLIQTTEAQHQSRGVKKGLYNKNFSFKHLQHDVALLELSQPVTLSATVQPVCLSDSDPPFGDKGVLAGWGKTGKHLPPSTTLRTVKMRIIPHEECQKTYAAVSNAPPVTTNMVCAGETSPTLKDACNGDSGGPLSKFTSGKAIQFGVVSWGIGCGEHPGVYTRVDKYLAWINKNSRRRA